MLDWEVVTAVGVVAGALIALYFGTWNLVRSRRLDLPVESPSGTAMSVPLIRARRSTSRCEAGADRWRVSAVGIRGEDRIALSRSRSG